MKRLKSLITKSLPRNWHELYCRPSYRLRKLFAEVPVRTAFQFVMMACIFVVTLFTTTQTEAKDWDWHTKKTNPIVFENFNKLSRDKLAFHVFFAGSEFVPCKNVSSMPVAECKKLQDYMLYATTLTAMVKNFGGMMFGHHLDPYNVITFARFEQFYTTPAKTDGDRFLLSYGYDFEPFYNRFKYSLSMSGVRFLTECLKNKCSKLINFTKYDSGKWSQIWSQSISFYTCMYEARAKLKVKIVANRTPVPEKFKNFKPFVFPEGYYRQAIEEKQNVCGIEDLPSELVLFSAWNLLFGVPSTISF